MCGTGCSCGEMFLKVNWIYFVFLDTLHMYDIVIPEMVIFLEANTLQADSIMKCLVVALK